MTNRRGFVPVIVFILIAVALIAGGAVVYKQHRQVPAPAVQPAGKQVAQTNYKNENLVSKYPVLRDRNSWASKLISSNVPFEWQVPDISIAIKGDSQSRFYCGKKQATVVVYSSFNSGAVGGWGSISVVDCGDSYFVYDYGDAGPHLAGPFSPPLNSSTNSIVSTTEWQTYHNEKYGFEFKYPPGWEVKDALGEAAKAIILARPDSGLSFLGIKSGEIVPKCSLFTDKISCDVLQNEFGTTYLKAIHTEKVTSGSVRGPVPLRELSIIVQLKGNLQARIDQFLDDWDGKSLANIEELRLHFDRILSTFKFTQ